MTRVTKDGVLPEVGFTMPVRVMLASPMTKSIITDWTNIFLERKYDGHRIEVRVFENRTVKAWTRRTDGEGGMNPRELPPALVRDLVERMMPGVYDGELIVNIADGVSTDVTRKDLVGARHYVIFDVLALEDADDLKLVVDLPYTRRRELLLASLLDGPTDTSNDDPLRMELSPYLSIAQPLDITKASKLTVSTGVQIVHAAIANIWERGGEGAILKRGDSRYAVGKRNGDWMKIKRVVHDALTVVGFKPTRGKAKTLPARWAPFAMVRLRDDDGNETSCKTRNHAQLEKFAAQYLESDYGKDHPLYIEGAPHPSVGRKLVIEHFGRTREQGYRGPVTWDRWEDE